MIKIQMLQSMPFSLLELYGLVQTIQDLLVIYDQQQVTTTEIQINYLWSGLLKD